MEGKEYFERLLWFRHSETNKNHTELWPFVTQASLRKQSFWCLYLFSQLDCAGWKTENYFIFIRNKILYISHEKHLCIISSENWGMPDKLLTQRKETDIFSPSMSQVNVASTFIIQKYQEACIF